VAPPRRRRTGSHVKLKRCTRSVLVKGFSFGHSDHAGSNSLGFTGVIGRHKLAPGSYRLSLTAHVTGKTSRALAITFVISPPPRRGVARHHSAD
jgi:hypothetical protein